MSLGSLYVAVSLSKALHTSISTLLVATPGQSSHMVVSRSLEAIQQARLRLRGSFSHTPKRPHRGPFAAPPTSIPPHPPRNPHLQRAACPRAPKTGPWPRVRRSTTVHCLVLVLEHRALSIIESASASVSVSACMRPSHLLRVSSLTA